MGGHLLVRAHDLDDRSRAAAGMRAPSRTPKSSGRASGSGSSRRDYDRRKRKGPIRRTGRPLWRQPMLLGLAVLQLGAGGGGGWWAWHEGWLGSVQAGIDQAARGVVAAVTPFKQKSTRLNSSHTVISYAVFCLKKKKK